MGASYELMRVSDPEGVAKLSSGDSTVAGAPLLGVPISGGGDPLTVPLIANSLY